MRYDRHLSQHPDATDWYYTPNIGLHHANRTPMTFMDGHADMVAKSSPITFGGTNDYYWALGQ